MWTIEILLLTPRAFLIGFMSELGGDKEDNVGFAFELMLGFIGIGVYYWPGEDEDEDE